MIYQDLYLVLCMHVDTGCETTLVTILSLLTPPPVSCEKYWNISCLIVYTPNGLVTYIPCYILLGFCQPYVGWSSHTIVEGDEQCWLAPHFGWLLLNTKILQDNFLRLNIIIIFLGLFWLLRTSWRFFCPYVDPVLLPFVSL